MHKSSTKNWALIVPIAAIVILITYAVRQYIIGSDWTFDTSNSQDLTYLELFFAVFGLIYAIIVGLLIVEAHRRIRELSSAVQAELNAAGDINDFLRYFNARDRAAVCQVLQSLLTYIDDVVKDMKPRRMNALGGDKDPISQENERTAIDETRRRHITDIIDRINELPTRDKNDEYALDSIMKKMSAMTSFRAQKTEIARRGFPQSYYTLLILMSLVLVLSLVVFPVDFPWLHYFVVVNITAATYSLYIVIRDLDNPLVGKWTIQNEVEASVRVVQINVERHLVNNWQVEGHSRRAVRG